MITNPILFFIIGSASALFFECLKAYELKSKLSSAKATALTKSKRFWAIFVAMIIASGFFTLVFYADAESVKAWHLAVTGIASRSIIRTAITTRIAASSKDMGDAEISNRDLFL